MTFENKIQNYACLEIFRQLEYSDHESDEADKHRLLDMAAEMWDSGRGEGSGACMAGDPRG